jgi:hypothetical protein
MNNLCVKGVFVCLSLFLSVSLSLSISLSLFLTFCLSISPFYFILLSIYLSISQSLSLLILMIILARSFINIYHCQFNLSYHPSSSSSSHISYFILIHLFSLYHISFNLISLLSLSIHLVISQNELQLLRPFEWPHALCA